MSGRLDARVVPHSDETYIVRVRGDQEDAVVEKAHSGERRHVRDLSELGTLIVRWRARGRAARNPNVIRREEER